MQRGIVGRHTELARFAALADEPSAADEGRLIFVVGPAGIGKSAFAREVVRRHRAVHPEVAERWIDLTGAPTSGVDDLVGHALGRRSGSIGEALLELGPAIVVLDAVDCEHPAIAQWTATAPEALVVVTSRRRPAMAPSEAGVLELGPLTEAADLFAEVARSVGAEVRAEDAPFVAALVLELGGVPLAIALAAARTRVLGPRALLHRLKNRFDLLKRAAGASGPARHASLEAAIDASWDALEPHEQTTLAALSVFASGFSAAAAEAVVDLSRHPRSAPVVDVLQALVERFLVLSQPSRVPGESRLALDASVRAYAAHKLDAAAANEARDRHARFFVAEAEACADALDSPDGDVARLRVLDDKDDILVVAQRASMAPDGLATAPAELALRTLVALAPVLLETGPVESLARLLEPVLRATRNSGADPRLTARILLVRAALDRLHGKSGAEDLVRALSMGRALQDPSIEARALHEIGLALELRGDLAGAEEHQLLSLRAAELAVGPAADTLGGTSARALGLVIARRGRSDDGARMIERAIALHAAARATSALAIDHLAMASLALDRAEHARARDHLATARALARDPGCGLAIEGAIAHDEGDLDEAARAYGAETSDRFARSMGLAVVARMRGRDAEAWTLLREAAGLASRPESVALVSVHRANLEELAGRTDEAESILARARDARIEGGDAALAALLSPASPVDLEAVAARSVVVRLYLRSRSTAASVAGLDEALVVGEGGTWFSAPGGERVGLERRPSLALLLDRLVTERLERPGAALPSETLQRAAWPGEKILPAAGAHRVRVAVATLRKLGLGALIETTPAGYRLSATCPVRGRPSSPS